MTHEECLSAGEVSRLQQLRSAQSERLAAEAAKERSAVAVESWIYIERG